MVKVEERMMKELYMRIIIVLTCLLYSYTIDKQGNALGDLPLK